jgi:hypothetical protein
MRVRVRVHRNLSISLFSPFSSVHLKPMWLMEKLLWGVLAALLLWVNPWLSLSALAVPLFEIYTVFARMRRHHRAVTPPPERFQG